LLRHKEFAAPGKKEQQPDRYSRDKNPDPLPRVQLS
jgi:hypothetical protein